MSRRVATITLNPAYDLVGLLPDIHRGDVNLVKQLGFMPLERHKCGQST